MPLIQCKSPYDDSSCWADTTSPISNGYHLVVIKRIINTIIIKITTIRVITIVIKGKKERAE